MTKPIHFSDVTADRISIAYSGRPGCACGCRGKWSEVRKDRQRILTTIRKAREKDPESVEVIKNPDPDGARYIVSLATETRLYVLHVV